MGGSSDHEHDHGFSAVEILCPEGQTSQDELDFHGHCLVFLETGKLTARLVTCILAGLVVILALVHFIQFRRTTLRVFTNIRQAHLASIAMIAVFFNGLSIFSLNVVTFITKETGANRNIAYLFFSCLSFITFEIIIAQIIYAMIKILNQQLFMQKNATYTIIKAGMVVFSIIWSIGIILAHVIPSIVLTTALSFWLFGFSVAGILVLVIALTATTAMVLHRVRTAARDNKLSTQDVSRVSTRLKILMAIVAVFAPVAILVFLVPLVNTAVEGFQWAIMLVWRVAASLVCFTAVWLFGFTKAMKVRETSGSGRSKSFKTASATMQVGGTASQAQKTASNRVDDVEPSKNNYKVPINVDNDAANNNAANNNAGDNNASAKADEKSTPSSEGTNYVALTTVG